MTRTHDAGGRGAPGGGGTELEQRLSALLHDRAALAPEAPAVRAAAEALGVARRRRRQRAGAGVVLGVAGLVALAAPRLDDLHRAVQAPPAASSVPTSPARPAPPAASAGPVPPWTLPEDGTALPPAPSEAAVGWDQQDVDAFFGAGYRYADAVALAELWQHPGDVVYAKVTGGARLRAGGALPLPPGSAPDLVGEDPAWQAFTAAGHDVGDALELARLWQVPSGYSAALRAGRDLSEGVPLPALPPAAGDSAPEARAREAWTGAGYDEQDAEELALLWALGDADQAVLAGGSNVLDGQPLPVEP